ncbi:PHAF1 protein CG7083-like isoform X1 [Amphibalanus amphitrite]|uniref:PHAF1 protein CG7083-like isoform X1 n=2 Tax=Amphibalanus amphitrite TaxID=1232801 RepID=UPI001C918E53|nr:PHAF1 protein CG7083-like isoform X1 [Amphibalanus amphitrite]XP_043231877.1 PHAF1 protein CG7083-like isoform X1 [Amphibalanus amphitrite]
MLDLEVVPESSLSHEQWEFILGMHFSQAVNIIQQQVGVIRDVHISYSDTNPLDHDLVINMTNDGIRLLFDPVGQRLKVIEVYNLSKLRLKYGGCVFSSTEVAPSIQQVDQTFGATHPGIYDRERHLFLLNFRGLTFQFPVEPKFEPRFAGGLGSLQFPGGGSPLVSQMSIYSGSSRTATEAPPMPVSCFGGQVYTEKCDVIREDDVTKGVRLHLLAASDTHLGADSEPTRLVREVQFGDSCQDVATLLGAPTKVFYKSEDKMKIHSPFAHKRAASRRSDFFFNYFTLGIDILFDARTHRAKKILLHTNFPGHYNFNMYHRCNFDLSVDPHSSIINTTTDGVHIRADTKWESVCGTLKPSSRPVVLNRASTTNTSNPFGSTLCYGVEDFICEVMNNGHLASVTLYQQEEA